MAELSIRPAACADDRWYPHDAQALRELLDEMVARVSDPPVEGRLLGLVSPHAGYAFAGATAAHAYKQLEGRRYRRVILLGPNHRAGYYPGIGPQGLTLADYYETPLGRVSVDRAAADDLATRVPIDLFRQDQEHSLEMQLPFLQLELGSDWKLVPLMLTQPLYLFGRAARRACQELAAALLPLIDEQTLLVASSDLSHLPDYQAVRHFDRELEALLNDYDLDRLVDYMANEGECRACGDVAIITLLLAARARGANRVKVLFRTNSADVIGEHRPGQYTVGYLAAAVYAAPEAMSGKEM